MYMNNPYMNPVYAQQQQRLQQMEQMYPQYNQQQMAQGINGRIIDDITTVTANEVSMDGSISVFPTRNMQAVYIRQWQNDGNLTTLKFVPEVVEANTSSDNKEKSKIGLSDDVTRAFMDRFDSIDGRLDKLEQSFVPKNTTRKKVSDVDAK